MEKVLTLQHVRKIASMRSTSGMDMTMRDIFAAHALQGLLANPKLQEQILKGGGARSGWIEESAYAFADAMLEKRGE